MSSSHFTHPPFKGETQSPVPTLLCFCCLYPSFGGYRWVKRGTSSPQLTQVSLTIQITIKGLKERPLPQKPQATLANLIQAKPLTKRSFLSPCDSPALLGLRSGNLRIGWGQAVERVCSLTTSVCNCDSEVLNDMTANLSMAFGEH